jgi:hypothetical protein
MRVSASWMVDRLVPDVVDGEGKQAVISTEQAQVEIPLHTKHRPKNMTKK